MAERTKNIRSKCLSCSPTNYVSLLEFVSRRLCIETTEFQLGPFKVPCGRRENIERFSCEQVSRSKIRAVLCERSVRFEGDKVDRENNLVSPRSSRAARDVAGKR